MLTPATEPLPTPRTPFFWIRISVLTGLLLWQCVRLTDTSLLGVTDFVEYWCAARLNATGGDPYAPDQMYPIQQSVGWDQDAPMMMQNPPWTLALLLPFAACDFPTSQVIWLMFHLGLVFAAIELAWRFYGGTPKRRLLYWLIGLTFFPAIIVVRMGQIVPVMVIGLLGFLYFERSRKDWLAGAMLALVSVKPHLVYLVWPAMLIWTLAYRRWSVLAGAVVATLVAVAIPMCWNPHLLAQYSHALLHRPPSNLVVYPTPTIGTLLWYATGENHSWVRFIPSALGLAWLAFYLPKRLKQWDWSLQLPILILVSGLTAFYTWPFDMVLFLIPLLQITVALANWTARRLTWLALALHAAINAVALGLAVMELHSFWFFWMAPALVGSYFGIKNRALDARIGPRHLPAVRAEP